MVNSVILQERPTGWHSYLKNYIRSDMVIEEILGDPSTEKWWLSSVYLKSLGCTPGRGYYIRPGQRLGQRKFMSIRIKVAYCLIKALKKSLDVSNLSLYMVKKVLLKEKFMTIIHESVLFGEYVFKVLSQPELRWKFSEHIDFELWEVLVNQGRIHSIPLLQEDRNL